MKKFIILPLKKICLHSYLLYSKTFTTIIFLVNKVKFTKFLSVGIPLIDVHPSGKCRFGENLIIINNVRFSTLGKNNKCKFLIYKNAVLEIGNKVAISNTSIIATKSILIGNNVIIGGGVTIVDSDFHSLNPQFWHTPSDETNMNCVGLIIRDNVFIGMNSIILKGVTIGCNVIIAAGSVVSKNIPDNQIWGGNPAKFIKNNIILS